MQMKIGFIGLGLMGSGMAGHLMAAGHELWLVPHRNRTFIDPLLAKGANEAKDLAALAKESEAIILCLTSARVVEETIAGLGPSLRRGQIIVDTGTTAPETTRRLARELKALGIAYADAPMAGGPEQVAKKDVGALIG